ncbi:MAG: hypothetical protein CVV49_18360 [Spirochaetae bacterium HGW-Spirochaetae-5]|nr:MAG: hypothetical protein CVV49_18360 [Spirochaetae bacterium HGW-Spirochaetae-5]
MKLKRILYLSKRFIIFTILALAVAYISYISYSIVMSFNIDKVFKYFSVFKDTYQQGVEKKSAWKALRRGRIEFYSAGSEGICVVGLNRYNNVSIKNINIKNQDSGVKKGDFPELSSSIRAEGFPFINLIIYPANSEIENIDIFIKSKIEKVIRTDDYIYIKFEGSSVRLKSVEKYPEFSFTGISEPPVELMILKREGENLIIFKYGIDENKRGFTTPLTSMIDLK